MDFMSEHFYCREKPSVYEHVRQIPDAIRRKAEAHREYRKTIGEQLKGKNIRIAMDEWNYWYGPHVFGELGTRYFLKDALGIAAGINEYARQSDIVFMANYAQTVNVIGCIKTTKTAAAFATTGLVLKLYRKHFGQIPVEVEDLLPPRRRRRLDRRRQGPHPQHRQRHGRDAEYPDCRQRRLPHRKRHRLDHRRRRSRRLQRAGKTGKREY